MKIPIFLQLLLSAVITVPLFGQTAELSGLVRDGSGGAVANAAIRLRNSDTGVQAHTATNREGSYSFSLLKPGTYELIVEATGFKTIDQTNVQLDVSQNAIVDFSLEIGQRTETITVNTDETEISAEPSVSTVINRQLAENLPINGRSFQSLITLAPGVTLVKPDYSSGGQFSVNGQRADGNYFTVDGASANIGITTRPFLGQSGGGSLPGLTVTGGTNSLVSVDALQEFRIETSTYAPEYGRMPGGQIQIVTRSGTHEFHGALFDYFRNDKLDAADWFVSAQKLAKPALRQNDFGGVLGGPIWLPKVYNGRNKTFFFFSYEGLRLVQPLTGTSLVPSLAARQQAAPSLQLLLNAFPLPNGPVFSNGTAQLAASGSNRSNLDATSFRIDQVITDRMKVFGRYNHAPSDIGQRGIAGSTAVGSATASNVVNLTAQTDTLTIGSTQVLTPRVVNDFRANYSRSLAGSTARLDNFGGATSLAASSVFPSGVSANNASFELSILGLPQLQLGTQAHNELQQVNVTDTLAVTLGTHQILVGYDWRKYWVHNGRTSYDLNPYFFNGIGTPGASMQTSGTVLSGISSAVYTGGFANITLAYNNYSSFVQDTWRLTPRLTLTYGLRWDVNPAPHGTSGHSVYALTTLDPASAIGLAPLGTPIYQTRYGNFAPRIGGSYLAANQPGHEVVLRGGFGVFYNLSIGPAGDISSSYPNGSYNLTNNAPYPLSAAALTPGTIGPVLPITGGFLGTDPHLKSPRTYQWNGSFESGIGNGQSVSLTYVGASGRNLLKATRIFSPNPTFASLQVVQNAAQSDYNALQAQFKRRLAHGLQALASYTWSHSIDTASTDATYDNFVTPVSTGSTQINPFADRGDSDFDTRHSGNFALTYDLAGPRNSRLLRQLLGGWAADSVFTARSSLPVNIVAGTLSEGVYTGTVRPDVVAGQPLYLFDPNVPGGKRLNRAAFVSPANAAGVFTRQGTLGRNTLRGFGLTQLNFAIHRQISFTERVSLQLRAEAFNVLNHPNFSDFGVGSYYGSDDIRNATFGISQNTYANGSVGSGGVAGGLSSLYQTGGARSIQLALKLRF